MPKWLISFESPKQLSEDISATQFNNCSTYEMVKTFCVTYNFFCVLHAVLEKKNLFPAPKFPGPGSTRRNVTNCGDILFMDYYFLFSFIVFNLFLSLIYRNIIVHIPASDQYYGVNYFMCTAMLSV